VIGLAPGYAQEGTTNGENQIAGHEMNCPLNPSFIYEMIDYLEPPSAEAISAPQELTSTDALSEFLELRYPAATDESFVKGATSDEEAQYLLLAADSDVRASAYVENFAGHWRVTTFISCSGVVDSAGKS
jgi:hypothetical protein